MYTPKFNQVSDRDLLLEAMRAWPFAILFGSLSEDGQAGSAQATHLPLVVKDEGEHGLLEGHFARANPHWKSLAGREALVVFHGPHSYVSPTLYAEELSVPTWNYIAVHAYGTLSMIDDDAGKEALLEALIETNEPAYSEQWRRLPEGYRRTMLKGIIGFQIPISRIEGKFKLSQNRPEVDQNSVRSAHAGGDADQQALASWMARLSG
jgi:transcriptional regulator